MRVLLVGGAGYLGSHVCVELLQSGCQVLVLDNLSRGQEELLRRAGEITHQGLGFFEGDLRERETLDLIFGQGRFDAVILCTGLDAIADALAQPLAHYGNALQGLLTLCEAMAAWGVRTLILTSSATVYGEAGGPLREDRAPQPIHPQGRCAWFGEMILKDLQRADPSWRIALLRIFNPAGAHPSGYIGEDPKATSLIAQIAQVALGRRERLLILGNDYPTPDGTAVRDYVHVQDLARAYRLSLERLQSGEGMICCNLGRGRGYSVLEVITAFTRVTGCAIPYDYAARRTGDVACCVADSTQARLVLGWVPQADLDRMIADAWRWWMQNPDELG
ncbi:UDP-glucose 4-epimerase GalE [Caldichromatium japonicum]|uniref:UDP-glucose 4-epimerase n=1 Tax=Caldichromatium japonicum TaxID=2699430 RepID=A0A6G7VA65_9GAMM|nr:UDP-glucose 4-epimerase GalE [Caldichromatium japonicum]QIK36748.1 UDP-glucose 4-epimerase GalE [Caldichromatium japonicum]